MARQQCYLSSPWSHPSFLVGLVPPRCGRDDGVRPSRLYGRGFARTTKDLGVSLALVTGWCAGVSGQDEVDDERAELGRDGSPWPVRPDVSTSKWQY